jgi:hypothetical protein
LGTAGWRSATRFSVAILAEGDDHAPSATWR